MGNFDWCFDQLMINEGGYTVDNGGPTMYGITQATALRHGYTGDMRLLPLPTAKSIARAEYWLAGFDLVSAVVAFQLFDTKYNGGDPVRWLQTIVGVTPDGQLGPATAAAVNALNVWQVLALFNARRLQYFASLRQPESSGGRMNRIAHNLNLGGLHD